MTKVCAWLVKAGRAVYKFGRTAVLAAREYYGLAVALIKVWVQARGG